MRLSYFPYDFWECCCETVNAAVCVGTFRCVSAVLIAVYSTACPGTACCVRPGCSMRPWPAGHPIDGVTCGPTGVPGAGGPGLPRDLATSLRSAPRLEARPCPPDPPAPSTPVGLGLGHFWCGGEMQSALHTSGAGSLMCGRARRLEAGPGPAAAHRHRG